MEDDHADETAESQHRSDDGDVENTPEIPKKVDLVAVEPESDDEEDGHKSRASTAPGSRHRSAKGRSWKPERKVEKEKSFHASLVTALADERRYTDLTGIPKTPGLQGPMAETLYRSRRVVHNSPVVPAAKPPLVARRIRDAMDFDDGPDPNRPLCPHKTCRLQANDTHLQNFLHECGLGHQCPQQWEPSHRRYFWHPPNTILDAEDGEKGWKAETRRMACLPEFSASPYQNTVPMVSNCPRGGFRPQGGTTGAIQVKDDRKANMRKDTVSVAVIGIDTMWNEKDFASYVKMHTHAYVFGVQIERAFGYTTGTGFVQFGTYEDAQQFINELEGKTCGPYVLHLKYHEAVIRPRKSNTKKPPPHLRPPIRKRRDEDEPQADVSAVLAYNRMVKGCGPYCEDAAAVVERMRMEGHEPDANTYTLLIRSYGAHDPPKPAKAETVLERMLDHGLRVTVAAANMAVDAWARVGNMRRAEELVRRMEASNGVARSEPDGCEQRRLPIPNHETYEVLSNGWKRCGLMEEVGELTRGHFFPKERFPRDHTRRPQTVFNSGCATDQAPSLLSSWARRRAGFVPLHSGQMVAERPAGDKSSGLFVPSKWRPLC